jgi:hypothetical protein
MKNKFKLAFLVLTLCKMNTKSRFLLLSFILISLNTISIACNHTLRLRDTYGDGWNGGNNVIIANHQPTLAGTAGNAACPAPPANMSITSINVSQITTDFTNCGSPEQIIQIQVNTTGTLNPINFTQFVTKYTGSSPIAGISSVSIYFTNNSSKFNSMNPFGQNNSPSISNYVINGNQTLWPGTNYFWLVYQVNSNATAGLNLDGIVSQFTAGGVNFNNSSTPAFNTTNPAGSRPIIDCPPFPCLHRICLYDNASFNNGTAGGQIQVYVDENLALTVGPLDECCGIQNYLETWFMAASGSNIRVVRSIDGTQPANMRYWLFVVPPDYPDSETSINGTINSSFNRITGPYSSWMIGNHLTPLAGTATTGGHTFSTSCTNPVPLPIDLINFNTALNTEKKVEITWQTSSERNNDYFTIEKSSDGENWSFFANVKGSGNSSSQKDYSIIDENPLAPLNYYRLSQTDYNGIIREIGIRSLELELSGKYYVSPNPAKNQVSIIGSELMDYTIELFNNLGQKIRCNPSSITETKIELYIEGLSSGIYYLSLSKNDSTQFLKLLIEN